LFLFLSPSFLSCLCFPVPYVQEGKEEMSGVSTGSDAGL
jgi:hypothetical protein